MTGEVCVRIGGLVVGALVACAPLASAGQEAAAPPRPFRAGSEATGPRRALTVDFAVHEAAGQAEEGQVDGYSTNARLNGTFTARGRYLKFDLAGGTEYRYYAGSDALADQGRHGRVGLEASGRTTRFTVAQTVRQLPFQQLVGLPSILGDEVVADTSADHALDRVPNTVYGTSVAVHRTLGRDGSLMVDYDLGMSRVTGRPGSQDVHRGGALFTQRVARSLDLRLGYHARSRQPGPDATLRPVLSHDIDAGFAFTRGLSLTRRTNLMFTSGSSILSSDLGRQYVLTGSAGLNHMIGRTWNASLTFDRGVEFPDALPTPVVSDRLTVGIGGLWGRRVNLRARATGGIGNTSVDEGQYRTFGAELRAAVLVGRRWHWFAEPFYFQHDASGIAVTAGLPAATSRFGVRTGLDVQLAFLDRRRR